MQTFISFLGVVVGALGAGFGLYQYRRNQIWRETEFVANQTKEFFADDSVRKALRILDWEKRFIDLLADKPPVFVTRDMLREALKHGPDATKFTHEGAAIRDVFDTYFTRLEAFEQFIKAGVIEFRQIEPYQRYWAGILAGQRPKILDPETIKVIWGFLHDYGYNDAMALMKRYHPAPIQFAT
ncbi:MAG: hypothetical protein WDO17_19670 [Alphaproteobacteria bacterium]